MLGANEIIYNLQSKQQRIWLVANLSFVLRTGLHDIKGFTKLLTNEKLGTLSSEQKEYLYDIMYSSNEILNLITNIKQEKTLIW